MSNEELKLQAVQMNKISELFVGLDDNTVKSLVAIKNGEHPIVHFIAVPHNLANKLADIFRICQIQLKYVEVIASDFGELEVKK